MQTFKGKRFILEAYGLRMHLPALCAGLCLSHEVSMKLHHFLTQIRMVKQGTGKGKLRASAGPLPRFEPWYNEVLKFVPTIPNILEQRISNRLANISIHRERGDGRDFKQTSFVLACPHCGSSRECSKLTLFKVNARCINCSTCKCNTTSTRWSCPHGIAWHHCPLHREQGMRCGTALNARGLRSQAALKLKASSHSLRRLRRIWALGSLGETSSTHSGANSSTGSSRYHFKQKN